MSKKYLMNKHLIIGLSAFLAPFLLVPGYSAQQQRQQQQTRTQQDPVPLPPKSGLPAPRRDISGVWLGLPVTHKALGTKVIGHPPNHPSL